MHEIFDELESQAENRSPRPDPRQRGRGRGSGPKRGRGALIALLLTFVVVVCFVIMQPRGGTGRCAESVPGGAARSPGPDTICNRQLRSGREP